MFAHNNFFGTPELLLGTPELICGTPKLICWYPTIDFGYRFYTRKCAFFGLFVYLSIVFNDRFELAEVAFEVGYVVG